MGHTRFTASVRRKKERFVARRRIPFTRRFAIPTTSSPPVQVSGSARARERGDIHRREMSLGSRRGISIGGLAPRADEDPHNRGKRPGLLFVNRRRDCTRKVPRPAVVAPGRDTFVVAVFSIRRFDSVVANETHIPERSRDRATRKQRINILIARTFGGAVRIAKVRTRRRRPGSSRPGQIARNRTNIVM